MQGNNTSKTFKKHTISAEQNPQTN